MHKVNKRPSKYIWNYFTPQIIDRPSLSICVYFFSVLVSVLEAKEAIDQVARYRRSSRGTALFQCLQGMHHKQAIVPDWDRNVLELALKRSFLSLWGMLPRTVQSIFTDDSSPKVESGDLLLSAG